MKKLPVNRKSSIPAENFTLKAVPVSDLPQSEHIRHVDITSLPKTVPVPDTGLAVVFWFQDWPVGQVHCDGRSGVGPDIEALARTAVSPTVMERARIGVALEKNGRAPDGRRVSVVICTRDRPDELARCLASLAEQTRVPDQIVVVDNASDDNGRTREVALAAGVNYVREDRPGLDIARNCGVHAASGDIVAYTDDDVRLHPHWLERLVAAFDDATVMSVTGLVLPGELTTAAQRHFERFWGFGRGFVPILFDDSFFGVDRKQGCPAWEIGAGASMAFRREIFDRAGMFDERLDVGAAGCSGDSEYWHRILSHGFQCRYEPSAVAFHFHRRDFAGLSRQIFAYMRGHSAALLVQYERTGHFGNLRRAFVSTPLWYARRLARGLLRGRSDGDLLLGCEIRGFISGLLFYLRTPRPKKL
jgi:glycosyltransferase involved in cell wall biosynthesis